MLEADHPVSDGQFSQLKLRSAMIKLCAVVAVHSHFCGDSQIVGNSIRVGISTFSIVEDLGFEGGRCREYELSLLIALVLHLLHMLRKRAAS